MDFVNDTPTSPYGLALELMGLNFGGPWNRFHGLSGVHDRVDQHTYNGNLDINGYNSNTYMQMPGDVRDFGNDW